MEPDKAGLTAHSSPRRILSAQSSGTVGGSICIEAAPRSRVQPHTSIDAATRAMLAMFFVIFAISLLAVLLAVRGSPSPPRMA
jgi:hypothetical protein